MASFDFIDSSMKGYQTTWEQREPIARLCVSPLLIKLGCAALVLFLGLQDNFLRQGLILLPAHFAEGFMISYVICMIANARPITGEVESARPYRRQLMAGTLVYVLIKLGVSFFAASILTGAMAGQEQAANATEPPEVSGHALFAALFMLVFMIWIFRFLWLYIPAALGVPMLTYARRVQAFSSSFPMIGCWLICFVPLGVVMLIATQIILSTFPSGEEMSQGLSLALTAVQSLIELVVVIVSSIAMTYGVRQILEGKHNE